MSISFETLALAKRYTQEAVSDAIGGITQIDFRFVETLPWVGEAGVVYCVPVNSDDASDLYDEYYYINGHFERLPGVRIDLTPYATKNWVTGEGYYKKPADGIPGTDLDAATKAAIAKAETALQEHQSLAAYRTANQQDKHDAAYIEKLDGIEAHAQVNVDEIAVGNTQPTDPNVKLWMYQNQGQKIEIPTMEDFRNLKPATDEQVSAAVTNWFEENISGGETIAVDKSLTVEGAAADAKTVGELKRTINEISVASKNLFDKETATRDYHMLNSSGKYNDNANSATFIMPCETNTTYTVSKTRDANLRIGYSDALPVNAQTLPYSNAVADQNIVYATITTDSTAKYLVLYVYNSTSSILTYQQVLDSLQVEIGSEATSYEAFGRTAVDTLAREGVNSLKTDLEKYGEFIPLVELTNYSESRLQTETLSIDLDREKYLQLWLSNDSNYEAILMGSNSSNRSSPATLATWGCTYEEYNTALLTTTKPYFWLYFRNKTDTDSAITPNELHLKMHDSTELQDAVVELYNEVDKLKVSPYEGKTFAVFCDSIGTHGNEGKWHNVPEIVIEESDVGYELSAYVTYYDLHSPINRDTGLGPFVGLTIGGIELTDEDIGTEITFTPTDNDIGKSLGNVFDWNSNSLPVWWTLLAKHYKMEPIPVCWASSSYSSHEESILRLKAAYAWHPSQIRKAGIRTAGSMTRTAPDYVILARGCNDMTHLEYDILTNEYFDNVDWSFPSNDVVEGGYGLKEAIAKTIQGIWNAYPNTKIVLCTIPYVRRIDYNNFPTNNDDSSYPQWNDAIRECANFFGCGLIDFSKDGITHANLTTYAPDRTHPNAAGHALMGKQAIKDWKLI